MAPSEPIELLTVQEVAKMLERSPRYVRGLIKERKLHGVAAEVKSGTPNGGIGREP